MIPSTGGIALCRLGANKNAMDTLLRTLEKMSYRIRTAMGISEESYSIQSWVLGTLQGSGASPAHWLAITSILLGEISKQSSGITFSNPRQTLSLQCAAETYVDDTELMLTSESRNHELAAQDMPKNSSVLGTASLHNWGSTST